MSSPAGRWITRRRCAAGLAMALCAAAALAVGCQQREAVLEVPISNWPGYEYMYLAHKLGLDRREGLTIKPLQFPDPQAIVHAYLRGDVAVAQLTTVEAVDLCSRVPERCPVIVLVLDESRGGDQIAVANGIGSLRDLRGREVAVSFSTLGPYVLSRALAQQQMSLADVRLRNLPLASMPDALRSGEVQAAVFFPPFSSYAARDGSARVLFDSRAIPGEVFDVLAVDPRYLREHRREIVALIRAWWAAHAAARREPEKVVALAAQREQLSPEEYREAEQGLVYFDLPEQVKLLQPDGPLARNLRAVQSVQQELRISASGAHTPAVSPRYVEAAR